MPIFMDRHDGLQGVAAEDLIRAHMADCEAEVEQGVSFMTFWHDAKRGHVFCLVEAPDYETAWNLHKRSHGQLPSVVIEVPLMAVEAFLGRTADPPEVAAGKALPDSPLRAIMFTDIVGSTAFTERLGDARGVEMVRAHDSVVRRALTAHGGREVKHTGDGLMAVFDSLAEAAEAGRAIQAGFAEFNRNSSDPLSVRVGLHAGQPLEDSNDFFGLAVQIAARVTAAAEAGSVLATADFKDAVGEGRAWRPAGEREFKGLGKPREVFVLEGYGRRRALALNLAPRRRTIVSWPLAADPESGGRAT